MCNNHLKCFMSLTKGFVVIAIMILLSSCSHHVLKKDGPPDFYVDETKIPDAVPRRVKLSKYGNYPCYNVFGKRYYTLKSSKNYNEVGVASWYGTLYHSHPTSNGERYDMLSMTAAHKTLPLPTFVEVTNLKNHRKVIVKVNDRGPFESNRIIDLSYVAAKKLGMVNNGTTLVRVRAIDPDTYNQESPFVMASNNKHTNSSLAKQFALHQKQFYLQVGAFKNKQRAQQLRQKLVSLFDEKIEITNLDTNNLYKVKLGPIHDTITAASITHRLQELGIKSNKIDES